MINRILENTLTYYPRSVESTTFNIVADGIEGTFNSTYLVGQYVSIYGSVLNDGVYKITGVASGKLTLDADMLLEESSIQLFGLALPRAFLALVAEIDAYVAIAGTANLKSEQQGKRKVEYKGGSNWSDNFGDRLADYRSIYDDRFSYCRRYNIDTKGW